MVTCQNDQAKQSCRFPDPRQTLLWIWWYSATVPMNAGLRAAFFEKNLSHQFSFTSLPSWQLAIPILQWIADELKHTETQHTMHRTRISIKRYRFLCILPSKSVEDSSRITWWWGNPLCWMAKCNKNIFQTSGQGLPIASLTSDY